MHRYLFVLPFIIACGRAEVPPADSAAMAPAALTDADVSGTWTGTLMLAGTDSILAHWTDVCGGGTCRLTTTENPKDTVPSTYVIEGDSVRGTSTHYAEPTMGGTMVFDEWVGRISGNTVNGTGMLKLAAKPDSIVFRYRFTGTK